MPHGGRAGFDFVQEDEEGGRPLADGGDRFARARERGQALERGGRARGAEAAAHFVARDVEHVLGVGAFRELGAQGGGGFDVRVRERAPVVVAAGRRRRPRREQGVVVVVDEGGLGCGG